MSTQSAYSSTHPDVMAALDKADRLAAQLSAKLLDLKAEFGADAYFADQWGARRFVGFGTCPDVEGVAWKAVRNGRTYWPKQTTKQGKALAKRFDELFFKHGDPPGMSAYVLYGATHYNYGLFRHHGVAWVSWSCSHDVVETYGRPAPNVDMWERRKLSEYHAAREAAEDRHVV